jgi:hypothetical protein
MTFYSDFFVTKKTRYNKRYAGSFLTNYWVMVKFPAPILTTKVNAGPLPLWM